MIKKTAFFVLISSLFALQGCYDDYKEDFGSTSTYFARQFPLRTLVEEDGKDFRFEVGVVLGGKYENTTDEKVGFIVQDTLLKHYPTLTKLPESYYSLQSNMITIPKGEFKGAVEVILNKEKFINDPLAIGKNYALPLQIVSTTANTVLKDKHYTIIVLKYYNKYHGWYYRKGRDTREDLADTVVNKHVVYSNKDMVLNKAFLLESLSKNQISVPFIGSNFTENKSAYTMQMDIADNKGTLAGKLITPLTNVSGTIDYHPADKKYTMKYNYKDKDGKPHLVLDTLYFRNTELFLENWK